MNSTEWMPTSVGYQHSVSRRPKVVPECRGRGREAIHRSVRLFPFGCSSCVITCPLYPIADMCRATRDVCFGPIADMTVDIPVSSVHHRRSWSNIGKLGPDEGCHDAFRSRKYWPSRRSTRCRRLIDICWIASTAKYKEQRGASPLLGSLLGVKRTCRCAAHMSAFDPKRTWLREA